MTKLKASAPDSQRANLTRWLQPRDSAFNHRKALKQRCVGTGNWIFQNEKYQKWTGPETSCLWLNGVPGSGKTVLTSTIIEELRRDLVGVDLLHFYFDFSDDQKQTTEDLARTFIYQLCLLHENFWRDITTLYSACGNGIFQPSCDDLCDCLTRMLAQRDQVCIVLDAVDECTTRDDTNSPGLLQLIRNLVSTPPCRLHMLIVSQPLYDIKACFADLSCVKNDISIQGEHVTQDIQVYVGDRLLHDARLKRWTGRPEIQSEIYAQVAESPDAIFRSVACQLDDIGDCLKPDELRSQLHRPPTSLGESYNRIMRRIPESYRQMTIRILQLLLHSPGSITVTEAVDAVAVDLAQQPAFTAANRMPDHHEITLYCSSLVTTATEDSKKLAHDSQILKGSDHDEVLTLRLAHSSVQDHLLSDLPEAHFRCALARGTAKGDLAELCLAYLLSINKDTTAANDVRAKFPFAQYSAQNWLRYAFSARKNLRRVRTAISKLLEDQASSGFSWCQLYEVDVPPPRGGDHQKDPSANPLCRASVDGHVDVVKKLLDGGSQTNEECGSALMAAAANGHVDIVQILIDKVADIDLQNARGETALILASGGGQADVVEVLLRSGASSDLISRSQGTTLMAAARNGHDVVVQALLNSAADIDLQSPLHGTALVVASEAGHQQAVSMLLDAGASMSVGGGPYGTPMMAARYNDHADVLKLLEERNGLTDPKPPSLEISADKKLWIAVEVQSRQTTLSWPLERISVKDYMALYGNAHSIMHRSVVQREEVYEHLRLFVTRHVEDVYVRRPHATPEDLLRYCTREWWRFYHVSRVLNNAFRPINRHFLRRERDEGKTDVDEVLGLLCRTWKADLIERIHDELQAAVQEVVENVYHGVHADGNLIVGVANCFVSMDLATTPLDRATSFGIFNEYFAKPFLKI